MFGDVAHLAGRLPDRVDREIGHDIAIKFGECIGQRQPGIVIADQRDEDAARAERCDVARHVAGTADFGCGVPDGKHRRRRLRGDARHVAIDEVVEHDIADAEHGLLCDQLEGFLEVEHACCPVPATIAQRYRSARSRYWVT